MSEMDTYGATVYAMQFIACALNSNSSHKSQQSPVKISDEYTSVTNFLSIYEQLILLDQNKTFLPQPKFQYSDMLTVQK